MKKSLIALVSLGCLLLPAQPSHQEAGATPYVLAAKATGAKGDAKQRYTPAFYQMDPLADFDGNGSNFCAPAAVSNGLIYLALARQLEHLAPETDRDGQIALIKELAEHMETDPAQGTPPGRIIDGVYGYVQSLDYEIGRMEVAGWRPLGADNKEFSIGQRPSLAWLRKAAQDPDTVVLLNVGWYKAEGGRYRRYGGHWVTLVSAGASASEFQVRNPAIRALDQAGKAKVTLTALGSQFATVKGSGAPANMAGYFKVAGPGLPHGPSITAVLDCAMLFTVEE